MSVSSMHTTSSVHTVSPHDIRRYAYMYGLNLEPSDAQAMLCQTLPDAMFRVIDMAIFHNPHEFSRTIRVRTVVDLIECDDADNVQIVVLNEETREKTVQDNDPRTSPNQVTYY